MESFGLCILIAVVYAADAWLYAKGYNVLFFSHRTDEEKRLRMSIIRKVEAEAWIAEANASTYGTAEGGRDA